MKYTPAGQKKQAEVGRASLKKMKVDQLAEYRFKKGVPRAQQPAIMKAAAKTTKG